MHALFADNLEHIYFRQPWSIGLLLVLFAAALGVSAMMYVKEYGLSLWKRILLGGMRLAMFAIIVLLLFEPVQVKNGTITLPSKIVVLVDVSESMAFADDRKRSQDLEDAALALGKTDLKEANVSHGIKFDVARVSRIDMAKGILRHPEFSVFQKPGNKFKLQFYAFGDKLNASPGNPKEVQGWIDQLRPQAPATHLGDALLQAQANCTGQPLAAMIVLTDGGSNGGIDPLEAATKLKVPVFSVPIGTPQPEDVRLVTATIPKAVFPKDKVPVQVQIEASPGYFGREVEVAVKSDGTVLDSKKIVLQKSQFEELSFVLEPNMGRMETPGSRSLKLDVSVTPLAGEATDDNNQLSDTVDIIDGRIKVLYVEGRPRWEFRYLRAVLTRDPRIAVKFLLTEGDRDLANASSEYIARLKVDEKSMFDYDLVILGDVPAEYFTPAQLKWMEESVSKNGGSFLMLAGHQYAPMSYAKTPIASMLPVKVGTGGMKRVEPNVFPVPTTAGVESKILALEADKEDNFRAWSLARPLFDLPRLNGAKPGATVLATLSDQDNVAEPYPLVAWQRYGDGKTMYVGSDQLWRLRAERGDAYHAQYWSQAIQFLTLARLRGKNKRIYLETDRAKYNASERVMIQARLLDEEFLPVLPKNVPSFSVLVEQVPPQGEPKEVILKPVPGMEGKGIYQGHYSIERTGDFQVRPTKAAESDYKIRSFQVVPISREKLDLQVRYDLLDKLGELTGGKTLSVRDLSDLLGKIPDQSRTIELPPQETPLWNNWWVFSLILALSAAEWLMRRTNDIA